ncbi:ABC transporter ATP-binding protein [Velocimicrobium porci]|uniref:ABC transporter ATP-binding protein n=1 Tax=Velocimicrobium porci TaxID=2606634 RepID=A0A6L5XWX5_9FIRM|nr:ABC transporter ATP-binding protein [Velocimicrobium porci]MSS63262.1 ABC transporter ATP-binding protein [Velocimicrobium porci]
MIKMENISKVYNSGVVETKALEQVSFEIKKGEFVAVIGRSGCGKSTLLNILGGMDTATEGSYLFDDICVNQLRGSSLAQFRNKKIGFVFQGFYLVAEMSAEENVALPLGYAKVGKKERKQRALELLKAVGLEEKAKNRPFELSGGEQQRVAIARAIANEPSVLLADEPTGNLDEENSKMVMELLQDLHKKGLTIIMVTHDMELAKKAERIIQIKDGKIIKDE